MPISNIHAWSLTTSTALSGYYVKRMIAPRDVLKTLTAAGIAPILIGAHGLGGYMEEPRATQDVDVVVAAKLVKKAVRTLVTAFPHLKAVEHDVVVRLHDKDSDKVLIDVIRPVEPLYHALFKNAREVEAEGLDYRIPTLEMALAMKFAAMISPNRIVDKKHYDAGDFIRMVKQHEELDGDKLAELGELVYSGGGAELLEQVRRVRAGEKLIL